MNAIRPLFVYNAAATVLILLVEAVYLGLLPMFVGDVSGWLAAFWIAVVLVSTPLRLAVLHETLHGRLFGHGANEFIGRLIATCSGLAWEVVRAGHASHHRWTRHELDRPDMMRPGESRLQGRLRFAVHLLGGVYLIELAASWAQMLPLRYREHLVRRLLRDDQSHSQEMRDEMLRCVADHKRVNKARQDVLIGVCFYLLAVFAWRENLGIFFCAVGARLAMVGLLDNVAHHGTEARVGAQARDLQLCTPLSLLMFHGNLHRTHHAHPGTPWIALPAHHRAEGGRFHGRYRNALIAQLRGPVAAIQESGSSQLDRL